MCMMYSRKQIARWLNFYELLLMGQVL
jgi:hypothetical protein